MKINLERLEVLKRDLHGTAIHEDRDPLGLQTIMEALSYYVFHEGGQKPEVVKLLTDYGVLIEDVEKVKPSVPPHKFGD